MEWKYWGMSFIFGLFFATFIIDVQYEGSMLRFIARLLGTAFFPFVFMAGIYELYFWLKPKIAKVKKKTKK